MVWKPDTFVLITKKRKSMYKPTTFKEYQINRNIIDCCSSIERFLTTRATTIGLLQLILPIGWRISKPDINRIRWVERDLQVKQESLNNLYLTIKNNKVHIYQYYVSDFNKDFITLSININIDENDKVYLI